MRAASEWGLDLATSTCHSRVSALGHAPLPSPQPSPCSFVDDGVMHILMEYASGGTLHRRIVQQEGALLPEEQIWEWFVQVRGVGRCCVLYHVLYHVAKHRHRPISTVPL